MDMRNAGCPTMLLYGFWKTVNAPLKSACNVAVSAKKVDHTSSAGEGHQSPDLLPETPDTQAGVILQSAHGRAKERAKN